MSHLWPFPEAQAHLGKLIKTAETYGVQFITCQNQTKVVVLSIQDYQKLLPTGNRLNLVEFFQQSPLYGMPSLRVETSREYAEQYDAETIVKILKRMVTQFLN